MQQQQQQQHRIRQQALTQQQLDRFRQVQATRELCDQDADLAARLAAAEEREVADYNNREEDDSLERREATLLARRRQLESRLGQLADEADRLRQRCARGGGGGGDFTLARRMQDAEAQLAQVMSETEAADASLARCIADLDDCRWRRRRGRSERRSDRRRRRRRHQRHRQEEAATSAADESAERHQRSRSVDAWVQTGRLGGKVNDEFFVSGGSGGLPVVAPSSPIYDNPLNSAPNPTTATDSSSNRHPLAFGAPPARYAHTRQSLRQAVTGAATSAAAAATSNGTAVPDPRAPISASSDNLTIRDDHRRVQAPPPPPPQPQQQFVQRLQQQQPKQRPVSAYYFADQQQQQQQQQQPVQNRQPRHHGSTVLLSPSKQPTPQAASRNMAADLDPTYFTTDDLILSSSVGYHLRRPQPPTVVNAEVAASTSANVAQSSFFPAPVPGQRRSSASPAALKSSARKQQKQLEATGSGKSKSQCAQS